MRPILPDAEQFEALVNAGEGMRCQKHGDRFTNSQRHRFYSFWTGKDDYQCSD